MYSFRYFRCCRSTETSKVENVIWKPNYLLTSVGVCSEWGLPRFPSLNQKEDVQIGHAWVETTGADRISMAYCLPPCPGLCIHSEDRRLYSSFPPHLTEFTMGGNTCSARNLCHTCSVQAWTKDVVLGPGFECKARTVTGGKCLLTVWQMSPASARFSISWVHSFYPL